MSDSEPRLILFVCTGNTCRSPMAECMARHLCRSLEGWEFASAGICARPGTSASPDAVRVMKEINLDLSYHRSSLLTPELVDRAWRVVALTGGHRDFILEQYPDAEEKVCLLHAYSGEGKGADVMDPFGGALETYRRARDHIEAGLSDFILAVVQTASVSKKQPQDNTV